jgi:hypothetical protein
VFSRSFRHATAVENPFHLFYRKYITKECKRCWKFGVMCRRIWQCSCFLLSSLKENSEGNFAATLLLISLLLSVVLLYCVLLNYCEGRFMERLEEETVFVQASGKL